MDNANSASLSPEMRALVSLQERFQLFVALTADEIIETRVTLEVILNLQRAFLTRTNLPTAEFDELCRNARQRAQTNYESTLLTRWKALLNPESVEDISRST